MRTHPMKLHLLSLFILFTGLSFAPLTAQPGTLDPSFGTGGKVRTTAGKNDIYSEKVLVQTDGKIIVGGYTKNTSNKDFVVVRYNSDGTLDTTFGIKGKVTTDFGGLDDYILSAALQKDGKIVVAGYVDSLGIRKKMGIARYNVNGTLDSSFRGYGKVAFKVTLNYKPESIEDILIQPDGKIVAIGKAYDDMVVVRLDSNGYFDSTFNNKGWSNIIGSHFVDGGTCLALQPDGKIVAAGYIFTTPYNQYYLARLTTDGKLDTSFNSVGINFLEIRYHGEGYPSGIAIQSDGKIIIAGRTEITVSVECALTRLDTNGRYDKSFAGKGFRNYYIPGGTSYFNDVLIQPDGKILAVGTLSKAYDSQIILARINNDGSFDGSFNSTGFAILSYGNKYNHGNSLALQADNKIVVAGGYMNDSIVNSIVVARYHSGLISSIPHQVITNTRIYPNPANEFLNLEFNLTVPEHVSIYIMDMQGRIVLDITKNEAMEAGLHSSVVDLATLSNGAYILVLKTQIGKQSYVILR